MWGTGKPNQEGEENTIPFLKEHLTKPGTRLGTQMSGGKEEKLCEWRTPEVEESSFIVKGHTVIPKQN